LMLRFTNISSCNCHSQTSRNRQAGSQGSQGSQPLKFQSSAQCRYYCSTPGAWRPLQSGEELPRYTFLAKCI
jgi:hypothetical protein